MEIRLETSDIRNASIFEQITGVGVVDCLSDENNVYFIVERGKAGVAIGRKGATVKMIKNILGKNVKIFEHSTNLEEFVKNMIPSVKNMESNGDTIIVYVPRSEIANIIGKDGNNIRIIRKFLKRHFNIKNIKIR